MNLLRLIPALMMLVNVLLVTTAYAQPTATPVEDVEPPTMSKEELASRKEYLRKYAETHGGGGFAKWSHLHMAVILDREPHSKLVRALLAEGADPDLKAANGMAPLHVALIGSNTLYRSFDTRPRTGAVLALLKAGADVNVATPEGVTPLHLAVLTLPLEDLRFLLKKHMADANAATTRPFQGGFISIQAGVTPLHLAARHRLDVVRLLLEHGAGVNARDAHHTQPLHIALQHKQREIVELLLAKGAEVDIVAAVMMDDDKKVREHLARDPRLANFEGPWGERPLVRAVGRKNVAVVKFLLEHKADTNAPDRRGNTPLFWAVHHEILDLVQPLLKAGANPNLRSVEGETPLMWAAARSTEILKALLAHKADVGARSRLDRTPLSMAVKSGSALANIRVLLAADARVQMGDVTEAIKGNNRQAALLMLKTKPLVYHPDRMGRSVLHYLAVRNWPDVEKAALATGTPIQVRDRDGRTPLHAAMIVRLENNVVVPDPKDQPPTIKRLIKFGVPLKIRDKDGRTALHLAVQHNADRKATVINVLLEAGADPNVRDKDGRTPLHLAAARFYGFTLLTKALLEAGADPHRKDLDGKTPLDLARDSQTKKAFEAFARREQNKEN